MFCTSASLSGKVCLGENGKLGSNSGMLMKIVGFMRGLLIFGAAIVAGLTCEIVLFFCSMRARLDTVRSIVSSIATKWSRSRMETPFLSSRWISDVRARCGRYLLFIVAELCSRDGTVTSRDQIRWNSIKERQGKYSSQNPSASTLST